MGLPFLSMVVGGDFMYNFVFYDTINFSLCVSLHYFPSSSVHPKYTNYQFSLISAPGSYLISKFLGATIIRRWCLKVGDIYFKVKEINSIKFQNFHIAFFKMKMRYKTPLSIIEKIWKYLNVNNMSIVPLFVYLVLLLLGFS